MKRVQDKTVRNARMNKLERKQYWKSVGKMCFFMLLLLIVGGGLWFGNWVLNVLAQTPDLDRNRIVSSNTTRILDRYGNVIHETGINREWVHLHEISPVMIDAILAIEDARFFEHHGVDWTRTLGAQVFNVQAFIDGVGGLQGGSTLTQQLINQTHLLDEETGERDVTVERKLQEMVLSFQAERILSKDQIIEAYLNYSPFGGGIYGIQAASEFYFGVNASDLTLSQAATLAGLVQAPNDWRPDWNTHLTEQRRNAVLEMMYRHGYITDTLRDLAASEPISDMLVYYTSVVAEENAIFRDFINHVLNEAYNRWGIEAHEGYIIETYLDPQTQATVMNAMVTNDDVLWPNEHIQGAAAVIETQTGIIRALAGRNLQQTEYEQNLERGFVMATDIQRPIGSTSKPIWAYGPAMEHLNWGAGTMLDDDVFAYQNGVLVRNWSQQHEGRVTLRQAMAPSWNPPALQAFNAVMNVDQNLVVDFVTGLGIPEDQVGFYDSEDGEHRTILESYAIGGNETGLAPLHLAGAYAAFGNTGVYNEPRAIARIIAPDGTIHYQPPGEAPFRTERMMREETAYMMTDVLRTSVTPEGSPDRGPVHYRTGHRANISGFHIAAKTGTTDLNDARTLNPHTIPPDAVGDVWIAGYTNEFTMAVWVGYESINHSIATGHFLTGEARNLPDHVFREVMARLHPNGAPAPEMPAGVVQMPIELMSGHGIGETCSPSGATPGAFARMELFHAGFGPSCVSTRFSMPDAPANFQVSTSDLTFEFSWNHINHLPMTLAQAQAAVGHARGMILGSQIMTDAIRNMNPTEGQAAMMVRQIQAIGASEYVVMATLSDGGVRELGTTTNNALTVNLSLSEIASIQSFHVITRFSQSGQSSGPSNVVPNEGRVNLPASDEIEIPDMTGWALSRVQQWAIMNHVEFTTIEMPSSEVPAGQVITTSPTGTMRLDQTLIVTLSSGEEQVSDDEPQPLPPTPPEPEVPNDPDDAFDDDDPLDEIITLMGLMNRFIAMLPDRKGF